MKKILATAAVLALSTGFAAAQDVVRIGSEGAYPPYNFLNDKGELDGYERGVGDEICKRAELTCEWVINDWDSIIPNLVSGNYDMIMAGMSVTDERKQVIAFSDEYVPAQFSIFVAKDESVDLKGGVIASQVGTIQAGYIAESGATLLEFPVYEEAAAAVANGEADAFLADREFSVGVIEANPELKIVDRVQIGGGIGVGLRQTDTALAEKINAALASMKADGWLNAHMKTWLGEEAGEF